MTWKELSINPTESFSSLAFDPETPGTLYVCSYYRPLRKSTDSGQTWTDIYLPDNYLATQISVDPHTLPSSYLGLSVIGGYGAGGVLKSSSGGLNWTHMDWRE